MLGISKLTLPANLPTCACTLSKAFLYHLTPSNAGAGVQGSFQVSTQQPINYTIEEVEGLLDPANKVSVYRPCFYATTPANYVP